MSDETNPLEIPTSDGARAGGRFAIPAILFTLSVFLLIPAALYAAGILPFEWTILIYGGLSVYKGVEMALQ